MKIKVLASLLGLAVAVLFASCATELPSVTSWDVPTVAAKTHVTRDDFKKITMIKSPDMIFGGDNFVDIYRYNLCAERKDGEEKPTYYLMLFTQRGYEQSWAFWESAADQNGKEFKLNNECREVYTAGIVQELSTADVGREYVEALRKSGIGWRIYGQRATKEFVIAPNLAAGFLQKCDETFGPPQIVKTENAKRQGPTIEELEAMATPLVK